MDLLQAYPDTAHMSVNVAARFEERWVVWARVVTPEYLVAELRIYPLTAVDLGRGELVSLPDRESLRHGFTAFRRDQVPAGGIPFRKLRDIHERQLVAWAREAIEASGELLRERGYDLSQWRRLSGEAETPPELSTEERLALLAAEYVELLEDPDEEVRSHPNKVLAERYDRSAGWVATELHRARKRFKLLGPARGKGQPGGSLTKKGKEVLARAEAQLKEESER